MGRDAWGAEGERACGFRHAGPQGPTAATLFFGDYFHVIYGCY